MEKIRLVKVGDRLTDEEEDKYDTARSTNNLPPVEDVEKGGASFLCSQYKEKPNKGTGSSFMLVFFVVLQFSFDR